MADLRSLAINATAKHLPKKTSRITPAPEPIETKTDWNHYGPILRDTLSTVLRHISRTGIQHIDIVNARQLVKEIELNK